MQRSPRRTRFEATIVDRYGSEREIHILEYSEDEAIALAEKRGYTVLSIAKVGRKASAAVSGPGFRIDQLALDEAIEFLGLKLPVDIRFNGRAGRVRGNYRRDHSGHRIMLKSYLEPAQASRTLWHELAHAMQSERAGSVWNWNTVANERKPGSSRRIRYAVRPIEVEAREYEQYAEACPLVVPA